jgi:hypothetical protein
MSAAIFGKGNAHEERRNRGGSGSTELAIVVSKRSRREIFSRKTGIAQEKKKGAKETNEEGQIRKGGHF